MIVYWPNSLAKARAQRPRPPRRDATPASYTVHPAALWPYLSDMWAHWMLVSRGAARSTRNLCLGGGATSSPKLNSPHPFCTVHRPPGAHVGVLWRRVRLVWADISRASGLLHGACVAYPDVHSFREEPLLRARGGGTTVTGSPHASTPCQSTHVPSSCKVLSSLHIRDRCRRR